MRNPDEPKLTEEEILVLLAGKRRAARLQSLQRISSLGRAACAASGSLALVTRPPAPAACTTPVASSGAGRCLVANVCVTGIGGRSPQIAPAGWSTTPESAVYPHRLTPLAHTGSRQILDIWTAAIRRQPWGRLRDRALFLVELVALAALVFVVAGSFSSMGDLNAEMADARKTPLAAAATAPVIAAFAVAAPVVEEDLPGGSAPPYLTSDTPGPLRSMSPPGVISTIPTPGVQTASRIVIPGIDVDSVIVEGDSWEDLKKGVGHHLNSANAGEKGNAVYSGHVDVFGEVFRRLEELKPGDLVTIHAGIHIFRYEVKRIRIVTPKETSVLAATSDATLTLITCYPYMVDTHRLVVIAKLVD
jgi:sortase A